VRVWRIGETRPLAILTDARGNVESVRWSWMDDDWLVDHRIGECECMRSAGESEDGDWTTRLRLVRV